MIRLYLLTVLASLAASQGYGQLPAQTLPSSPGEAVSARSPAEEVVKVTVESISTVIDREEKEGRLAPGATRNERQLVECLPRHMLEQGSEPASDGGRAVNAAPAPEMVRRAELSTSQALEEQHHEKVLHECSKEIEEVLAKWEEARTPAELEPLIASARQIRGRISNLSVLSAREWDRKARELVRWLETSRRFLEAVAASEAHIIKAVAGEFFSIGRNNHFPKSRATRSHVLPRPPQLVSDATFQLWRSRAVAALEQSAQSAAKDFQAAALRRTLAKDLKVLHFRFASLVEKLKAASFGQLPDSLQRLEQEATVAGEWARLTGFIEGEQWDDARRSLQTLMQAAEGTFGSSPEFLKAVNEKFEKIWTESDAATEQRVRTILEQVKDEESCLTAAREIDAMLASATKEGSFGLNVGPLRDLSHALKALAPAWNPKSTEAASLPTEIFLPWGHLNWSAEMAQLRSRAERAWIAAKLELPQLHSDPLAKLPLSKALREIGNGMVQRKEWQRLHDMLTLLHDPSGVRHEPSIEAGLHAVQTFIHAQNLERGEQWKDAAFYYQQVLVDVGDFVPTDAAVERLKILKKEHPEVFPVGP